MAKRDPKHTKACSDYKKDVNCRCIVCGKSENIETHHLREYAYQGSCNPENFVTLCSFHHDAVHRGDISIIQYVG